MKFAIFAVLLSLAFVSAELSQETSVLSNLENVESLINTEGLAAVQTRASQELQQMSYEQQVQLVQLASELVAQGDDRKDEKKDGKKDDKKPEEGVRVSFKWTNIDVRNFLTWIVTQDPSKGKLENIKLGQGDEHEGKHGHKHKAEKLTEEEEKKLRAWEKLRELDYTGPHDNKWFYRVRASGTMNAQNIREACHKYGLKPSGALNGWNDGNQADSGYNNGRYMSYMPHNLEDWQNWFNLGLYFYVGTNINGGWPLQNVWGTHRWSGWGEDSRWTLCQSDKNPDWEGWHKLHQKHHAHHGKRSEWAHKRYELLKQIKQLETTGQVRGQMHFFKVPVSGQMVHSNILEACLKYQMMPAQSMYGWQDGTTVDTPFSWGRYFSYPPHNIEGWQNSFDNGVYFDCAQAYSGYSLRNYGGSHQWSYGDSNGQTMCVSFRNPLEEWDMLHHFEGKHHDHHHHD